MRKEWVTMGNRMSRRQFLRVSAVAGGAGFLAACVAVAPQPGQQTGLTPAQEPVTLRLITHYGSPERREFTQRVKEIYEASHPGVTVEVEVAPDIDVRWQTEVAAKTLPV